MVSTLHLFGSIHIDRPSILKSELTTVCEDVCADAFFLEAPLNDPTPRDWLRYGLRVPLIIIGVFAYGLLLWGFSVLAVRHFESVDIATARTVTDENNIPTYEVDPQYDLLCSYGGPGFVALNWVGALGLIALSPQLSVVSLGALALGVLIVSATARISETAGSLLAVPVSLGWLWVLLMGYISWVLIAGILTFVIVARRTIRTRNEEMMTQISNIVDRDGIENGVLIVGKSHISNLLEVNGDSISVGSVWVRKLFRSGHEKDIN
jgi:hypothetical protein